MAWLSHAFCCLPGPSGRDGTGLQQAPLAHGSERIGAHMILIGRDTCTTHSLMNRSPASLAAAYIGRRQPQPVCGKLPPFAVWCMASCLAAAGPVCGVAVCQQAVTGRRRLSSSPASGCGAPTRHTFYGNRLLRATSNARRARSLPLQSSASRCGNGPDMAGPMHARVRHQRRCGLKLAAIRLLALAADCRRMVVGFLACLSHTGSPEGYIVVTCTTPHDVCTSPASYSQLGIALHAEAEAGAEAERIAVTSPAGPGLA